MQKTQRSMLKQDIAEALSFWLLEPAHVSTVSLLGANLAGAHIVSADVLGCEVFGVPRAYRVAARQLSALRA
eukprot:4409100-Amphidinium_carterae.1